MPFLILLVARLLRSCSMFKQMKQPSESLNGRCSANGVGRDSQIPSATQVRSYPIRPRGPVLDGNGKSSSKNIQKRGSKMSVSRTWTGVEIHKTARRTRTARIPKINGADLYVVRATKYGLACAKPCWRW